MKKGEFHSPSSHLPFLGCLAQENSSRPHPGAKESLAWLWPCSEDRHRSPKTEALALRLQGQKGTRPRAAPRPSFLTSPAWQAAGSSDVSLDRPFRLCPTHLLCNFRLSSFSVGGGGEHHTCQNRSIPGCPLGWPRGRRACSPELGTYPVLCALLFSRLAPVQQPGRAWEVSTSVLASMQLPLLRPC